MLASLLVYAHVISLRFHLLFLPLLLFVLQLLQRWNNLPGKMLFFSLISTHTQILSRSIFQQGAVHPLSAWCTVTEVNLEGLSSLLENKAMQHLLGNSQKCEQTHCKEELCQFVLFLTMHPRTDTLNSICWHTSREILAYFLFLFFISTGISVQRLHQTVKIKIVLSLRADAAFKEATSPVMEMCCKSRKLASKCRAFFLFLNSNFTSSFILRREGPGLFFLVVKTSFSLSHSVLCLATDG